MNLKQEYRKFKWFVTSNGKLVIGGKSAEQNEELLKNLNQNYIIMHTASPGSPFSVILSDVKSVKPSDLEETAIFTACFSQAWKKGKKKETIHIFTSSQIFKKTGMKSGTFGVAGRIRKRTVELALVLSVQKNKVRALPEKSAKLSMLKLEPGSISKEETAKKIMEILNERKIKSSIDEILQALPAGGFKIE